MVSHLLQAVGKVISPAGARFVSGDSLHCASHLSVGPDVVYEQSRDLCVSSRTLPGLTVGLCVLFLFAQLFLHVVFNSTGSAVFVSATWVRWEVEVMSHLCVI